MKICPACCYTGSEKFCPVCRKAGRVRLLFDLPQLRRKLERMRGEAMQIKQAIEKLEASCSNPT